MLCCSHKLLRKPRAYGKCGSFKRMCTGMSWGCTEGSYTGEHVGKLYTPSGVLGEVVCFFPRFYRGKGKKPAGTAYLLAAVCTNCRSVVRLLSALFGERCHQKMDGRNSRNILWLVLHPQKSSWSGLLQTLFFVGRLCNMVLFARISRWSTCSDWLWSCKTYFIRRQILKNILYFWGWYFAKCTHLQLSLSSHCMEFLTT